MAQKFDWAIIPDDMAITTVTVEGRHTYDLFNLTDQETLVYGERTWGINLKWGDPAKADNVRFERQAGQGPLKYDEAVAINIRNGGYLVYAKRRFGLNIGWSSTPRFEWKIVGSPALGDDSGEPIRVGVPVGLFSTVENDFVMYEPRDFGINLKWLKDSGRHNVGGNAGNIVNDIKDFRKLVG
jgi:hypothetical protein